VLNNGEDTQATEGLDPLQLFTLSYLPRVKDLTFCYYDKLITVQSTLSYARLQLKQFKYFITSKCSNQLSVIIE
jgi:hypothetical protein